MRAEAQKNTFARLKADDWVLQFMQGFLLFWSTRQFRPNPTPNYPFLYNWSQDNQEFWQALIKELPDDYYREDLMRLAYEAFCVRWQEEEDKKAMTWAMVEDKAKAKVKTKDNDKAKAKAKVEIKDKDKAKVEIKAVDKVEITIEATDQP